MPVRVHCFSWYLQLAQASDGPATMHRTLRPRQKLHARAARFFTLLVSMVGECTAGGGGPCRPWYRGAWAEIGVFVARRAAGEIRAVLRAPLSPPLPPRIAARVPHKPHNGPRNAESFPRGRRPPETRDATSPWGAPLQTQSGALVLFRGESDARHNAVGESVLNE